MQPDNFINPRDVPEYLVAAEEYVDGDYNLGYKHRYDWVYKYML
jgi:hypothetical protein